MEKYIVVVLVKGEELEVELPRRKNCLSDLVGHLSIR
jgi:hypothetical protein